MTLPALTLLAATLGQPPAAPAPAAGPQTFPLWPGKAPHAVGESAADKPALLSFPAPADTANGAAVVVCPGGGYGMHVMTYEGAEVAAYFNSLGVHAFVLKYRIVQKDRPGPLHPAPLLDAQRAVRFVRSEAAAFKIDPARVGVAGFSAGGHLASTAGTHFDDGDKDAKDPINRQGCRPDFLVLGYPVITMEKGVTSEGTLTRLLGKDADPKLVEDYSNEKRVTAKTPPTFIFHTSEDAVVSPENAVRFYLALKAAKVPAELHLYEKGRHGVGITPRGVSPGTDAWKLRLAEWLTDRGLVGKK